MMNKTQVRSAALELHPEGGTHATLCFYKDSQKSEKIMTVHQSNAATPSTSATNKRSNSTTSNGNNAGINNSDAHQQNKPQSQKENIVGAIRKGKTADAAAAGCSEKLEANEEA